MDDITKARKEELAFLAEQLEPLFGHVRTFIPVGPDGRKPDPSWLKTDFRPGKWSAAKALDYAKIGLESEDPQIVEMNHASAKSFLQHAKAMEIAHHRRKTGGTSRGADQTKAAAARWKAPRARFLKLLDGKADKASRADKAKARAIVLKEMAAIGWEPDKRTARNWLK
jgi:hypothetical protein